MTQDTARALLPRIQPAIRRSGHATLFHTIRVPWYLARTVWRLPFGLARIARGINRWRIDAVGEPDYRAALASRPGDLLKHREDREARQRKRTAAILFLTGLVIVLLWAGEYLWGALVWQATLGLLLAAALVVGPGRKTAAISGVVTTPVEAKPSETPIAPDAIAEAFSAALPAVAKAVKDNPRSLQLRGPAHRDGPGWTATVDLPPGVTVEDVVRARIRVASGLQIPIDRLDLVGGAHAGQVILWVGDRRPTDMPAVPWPLTNAGSFSMFDPIPIGVDMKERPVAISLMWGSIVVGGLPQMGKTAALRLIQSAAALDPACRLLIFDLKGGGDSFALAPAADVMRAGVAVDDMEALHATLLEVQEHMQNVYRILQSVNQPKLTKQLAAEHNLGAVLLTIDECQRAFKEDEIGDLVEDLVRRGPAAGIIVCLATQRPTADSIPTSVRDNTTARIAFRVQTQAANDSILGSGAYSSGADATAFVASDKGISIVAGDGADAVRTKMSFITTDVARLIAERCRRTEPVFAARPDGSPVTVIDELLAVWPDGRDRATCAELAVLLGWLDVEGEPKAADVTRAVKPFGIVTRTVRTPTDRATGVYLADLEGAVGLAVTV